MADVLGDLLPSAVGVALSPVPIIAVILMLGTPRARSNAPAFAIGWVVGLAVVSALVLLLSDDADDPDSGTSTGVAVAKLLVGLLFLVLAWKQWRGRPPAGEEAEVPGWMKTIDAFTPAKSLGLGAGLSGVNPKNLALTAAAAATIARAGLDGADTVLSVVLFVVVGSTTVVGPVLLYLLAGARTARLLASIKDFMTVHNAVIMMIVLLVLGANIGGEGVAGLVD